MSMAHLGPSFDIHTGGVDLIFPHHEDEIAQSEAATGQPFVGTWLHCAHLQMGGAKMAKSTGNIARVSELLDGRRLAAGAALRAHLGPLPREPQLLRRLARRRRRGRRPARRRAGGARGLSRRTAPTIPTLPTLLARRAGGVRRRARRRPEHLRGPGRGLRPRPRAQPPDRAHGRCRRPTRAPRARDAARPRPGARRPARTRPTTSIPDDGRLLDARAAARAARDWAGSDRLRDELAARGIAVEDTRDGQRWRRMVEAGRG